MSMRHGPAAMHLGRSGPGSLFLHVAGVRVLGMPWLKARPGCNNSVGQGRHGCATTWACSQLHHRRPCLGWLLPVACCPLEGSTLMLHCWVQVH